MIDRGWLIWTNLLALLVVGFAGMPLASAEEIQPYFLMDREPEAPVEPLIWRLHPDLLSLWKKALAHPESELRRQAAEAVAQCYQFGHAEMLGAVPDLLTVLTAEKVHPSARHAAAHALIVLDSKSSAAKLFEVSQKEGRDLRLLVEPALAKWNFEEIRPVWRQRIASVKTPRRDLILAIDGAGQQRDAGALEGLLALVMTAEYPADVRLAAARAAGEITDQGLEPKSNQLLEKGADSILNRLCGVSLIARHRAPATIETRQKLGLDPEAAVAGEALRSLFAIDPSLVLPLIETALPHADSNIRRIAIQTCVKLPTTDRVKLLSLRLNDPHPELRGMVRDAFFDLAKDLALDATVRQSSIAILAGDDWRGQEQAALVLGALDEESVTERLMELLVVKRPEVMVASAWSLKALAVPATAAPVLAFADQRTQARVNITMPIDLQQAHLLELLGRLKMVEAIPMLELYVPKAPTYGVNSRTAAVWALGVIQEGQTNERLAKQLMERVLDTMSSPPEFLSVRRASVLSLGRIRAKEQLPELKKLVGAQVDRDLFEFSLRWSIEQISGELLPIGPSLVLDRTGWFLEPTTKPK